MEPTAIPPQLQRDYQLVRSARERGDGKAYAALMSAYREPLYLLLLRMTRNPTDAADLTIETFGKAFNQLHRYSPTHSFGSWLFTIGTNTCIDFFRHKRVDTVPISDLAHANESGVYEYPLPSEQRTPEEDVIHAQRNEALRAAVAELKEPYRTIVTLRYFDELSYEQIASQLDIPMGTVKVRLSRARNLMATMLDKKGGAL